MIQILEIQNKIKRNIIDNSSYSKNNIHISFSIVEPDNLLMIHIYNPNSEKLIVNKNNKNFFTKVSNMLFSKNNKKKVVLTIKKMTIVIYIIKKLHYLKY